MDEYLRYRKITHLATAPFRAHDNDAGLDLHAISFEDGAHVGKPGQWREWDIAPAEDGGFPIIIGTGIAVEVPDGCVGYVFGRSGLSTKGVTLANGVGVIDAGYRGEIKLIMTNFSSTPYHFKPGEKMAQLVVQKVELLRPRRVENLIETPRGDNGLGSTGRFNNGTAGSGMFSAEVEVKQ